MSAPGSGAASRSSRAETMRVSDAAYRQAQEDGLIYTLNVPVKRAGAYQLRVAVRDAVPEGSWLTGRWCPMRPPRGRCREPCAGTGPADPTGGT